MGQFRDQAGENQVGVERPVPLDGVGLPVQAQLLTGEVLHQQAAELVLVQAFELGQEIAAAWVHDRSGVIRITLGKYSR